jgi:hypothetical protein
LTPIFRTFSLHWYLAVIVNPQWIIDNANNYRHLEPPKPQPKTHGTRGRTSTANTDQISLDSSSQPGTPVASITATGLASSSARREQVLDDDEECEEPLAKRSKYFTGPDKHSNPTQTNGGGDEDEEGDEDKFRKEREREQEIQENIQKKAADTEMGVPDDDDEDVYMVDPQVEGGGGRKSETLVIPDEDDELQIETRTADAPDQQHGVAASASTSTSTKQPQAARKAVPIGQPTKPPKGASSPQPQPPAKAPRPVTKSITATGMEIDEDETADPVTASELAQRLGADASLADR